MGEGTDIGIPGLPVNQASDALLKADPVLGAVCIFLAAALVAGALLWMRTIKAKDKELADAKAAHIGDLKTMIPAVQELKEAVLNSMARRTR